MSRGIKATVGGFMLWVASIVGGAVSEGRPQWADTATTVGFLAGVVVMATGFIYAGLRS